MKTQLALGISWPYKTQSPWHHNQDKNIEANYFLPISDVVFTQFVAAVEILLKFLSQEI